MQKVLLENLDVFARDVLKSLDSARDPRAALIALRGDLGAGKTTFVQALAKELGVADTVQSPTYVLMKSYKTNHPHLKMLVHIDLYRSEKPQELAALQLESYLSSPHNLICIEWPERAARTLPKPDLTITFSSEGATANERYIELAS